MKRDKYIVIAAKMGELTAEMNYYHNEIEVYNRYLAKRNNPEEDPFIVESILDCVEKYMRRRDIDCEEILKEQEIVKEFLTERASLKQMKLNDYCKKYGLSYFQKL